MAVEIFAPRGDWVQPAEVRREVFFGAQQGDFAGHESDDVGPEGVVGGDVDCKKSGWTAWKTKTVN